MENDRLDPSKNVDFAVFPPSFETLKQHMRRSNYQVAVWKRSDEPFHELPDAEQHGWVEEEGFLVPLWSEGSVLPSSVADLLEDMTVEEEENLVEEVDSDDSDSDN